LRLDRLRRGDQGVHAAALDQELPSYTPYSEFLSAACPALYVV
jgi:hypothetical protein